jgi:hypothetical protein
MRTLFPKILLSLACAFLLSANNDVIDLYAQRMQAEEHADTEQLIQMDLKLADHYLSNSKYHHARLFLEHAASISTEPELSNIKLDIYRLDIIESDFDRAESGLIDIYFYTENNEIRVRSSYLLGILNALKGKYDESKDYLMKSMQLQGTWSEEVLTTLDSLMKDANRRKSIEKAKWLSTFLPGAGQIYAKNAKGAVGAIGLAAFWGAWFAYDIVQQDYYSALLVLAWPWQRYHRGNIQNAGYSAEMYNAKIEDSINRALLEYLSK